MWKGTPLAAVLGLTNWASAMTLSVSGASLAPGEIGTVDLIISDALGVSMVDYAVYVGDGGEALGGTMTAPPAPAIIGDAVGPAWTGTGVTVDIAYVYEGLIIANHGYTSDIASVFVHDGVLFTLTVKANDPGEYPIQILEGGTAVTDNGLPLPYTIGPTSNIHVSPEPATLALLATAGLALRRPRSR